MVQFRLPGRAESGVWSYKVRVFDRGQSSPVFVDVSAVANKFEYVVSNDIRTAIKCSIFTAQ